MFLKTVLSEKKARAVPGGKEDEKGVDMSEIKNCLECPKDKTCSSWYGGSMCTEAPGQEADDEPT